MGALVRTEGYFAQPVVSDRFEAQTIADYPGGMQCASVRAGEEAVAKLFGNVAPVVVGLPTDDVDAEEDTYFNSFVNSIMQFDSIDTDINLNLTTEGLNVQARGNVVVTLDEDINVEKVGD